MSDAASAPSAEAIRSFAGLLSATRDASAGLDSPSRAASSVANCRAPAGIASATCGTMPLRKMSAAPKRAPPGCARLRACARVRRVSNGCSTTDAASRATEPQIMFSPYVSSELTAGLGAGAAAASGGPDGSALVACSASASLAAASAGVGVGSSLEASLNAPAATSSSGGVGMGSASAPPSSAAAAVSLSKCAGVGSPSNATSSAPCAHALATNRKAATRASRLAIARFKNRQSSCQPRLPAPSAARSHSSEQNMITVCGAIRAYTLHQPRRKPRAPPPSRQTARLAASALERRTICTVLTLSNGVVAVVDATPERSDAARCARTSSVRTPAAAAASSLARS
mmetsp:Transcript_9018/g.28354  ORF Transcript_9018/g.28354 Transcript_9018/m.28354 type:complete len:343 (-) Transcript_9018:126-1154(-)